MALAGKHVLVAVGGGISAFKAVELVRELGRRGAEVRVVMTEAATHFVGAVSFAGLTGAPAVTDLWDPAYAGEVHVELGAWANAIVVAPATANLIARAAHGLADDAVLATLACSEAPVFFAPAMHTRMWNRPQTREHVAKLERTGARFLGPTTGALASGDVGEGRMLEPSELVDAVEASFLESAAWAGRKVLITAGPTHEPIDPVRYIGNRSSGKMGVALAEAARARGAEVTLIVGPVSTPVPAWLGRVIRVSTAAEMHARVMEAYGAMDVVVMAAAVADYRPRTASAAKIKKSEDSMTLELVRNPDILADLGAQRKGGRPLLVGFALETDAPVDAARAKLTAKGADFIVANTVDAFDSDSNEATIVGRNGERTVPRTTKRALADILWDEVARTFPA